jgi:hypothetical protein
MDTCPTGFATINKTDSPESVEIALKTKSSPSVAKKQAIADGSLPEHLAPPLLPRYSGKIPK